MTPAVLSYGEVRQWLRSIGAGHIRLPLSPHEPPVVVEQPGGGRWLVRRPPGSGGWLVEPILTAVADGSDL